MIKCRHSIYKKGAAILSYYFNFQVEFRDEKLFFVLIKLI
jgi:hypothetical protein